MEMGLRQWIKHHAILFISKRFAARIPDLQLGPVCHQIRQLASGYGLNQFEPMTCHQCRRHIQQCQHRHTQHAPRTVRLFAKQESERLE